MSRLLALMSAIALILIVLVVCRVEEAIKPLWEVRGFVEPYHMWVERWVDVLAQALVLLASVAAVSHLLRRGVMR